MKSTSRPGRMAAQPAARFTTHRLVIALTFLALFSMAAVTSIDSDTWWHLRAGEWILTQRAVPVEDPFSYTRLGADWRYPGWLAEVQMAGLYRLLGPAGLNLWTAALVTLAYGLVWRVMRGGVFMRAFVLILAAAAGGIYWSARPHLVTLVLAAAFLYLLERRRREGSGGASRTLLWLPALMVVWVNSHGGFVVGFLIWGAYLAGELWHTLASAWRATPPCTPGVSPGVTLRAAPVVTPRCTPGISPVATLRAAPVVTPPCTPGVSPGVTLRAAPVVTPPCTPGVSPGATLRVAPVVTPPCTPGVSPGATLRAALQAGGWSRLKPMLWAGLGMAAALCISPAGPAMLLYPLKTVRIEALHAYIQEWQPPDFHQRNLQPFAWLLLLCLAAAGSSRRRVPLVEFLLVAGLAYMSLMAQRNIALFSLAAPLMITASLEPTLQAWGRLIGWRGLPERQPTRREARLNWLLLGLLLLAAAAKLSLVLPDSANQQAIAQTMPVGAVNWLRAEQPAGRLFNSYNWGGYLLWALPEKPVFIDGRSDLYDDALMQTYLSVTLAEPGWQQTLADWQVQVVLIEPSLPLARELQAAGWSSPYRDDQAVIFIRHAG